MKVLTSIINSIADQVQDSSYRMRARLAELALQELVHETRLPCSRVTNDDQLEPVVALDLQIAEPVARVPVSVVVHLHQVAELHRCAIHRGRSKLL